jgi:hypothetical protein
LQRVLRAKQISIWSFGKAEEGDLGSFVPLAMLQEVKKVEVEESNREINKRLSGAIKKLLELHEKERREKTQ